MQTPKTRQAGVYLITNTVTGKVYVGSAENMAERMKKHLRLLKNNRHHSFKLQQDFNRFDAGTFTFKPLLICAVKDVLFFEQRAIDQLNAVEDGYNVAREAGAPMRGRKHTGATKDRMSKASRGKAKSVEHAKAIGDSRRGKPLSTKQREGIKRSWETRRLTPVSEETRKKISATSKGRPVSQKSKDALIARNKARLGVKTGPLDLSPEERQRRIDANKARTGTKLSPEVAVGAKASKQATWAARKAAGLHTRRWYLNRGLQVPGDSLTSNFNHDESAPLVATSEE